MLKFLPLVLIISILIGQLVKIPQGAQGGLTFLDISIFFLNIFGLVTINFKLKKPPTWIILFFSFILVGLLSLLFTPLKLNSTEFILSFAYIIRAINFIFFAWLIYQGICNLKKEALQILTFSGVGLAVLGIIQLIFLPNLSFLQTEGWDPHYFRTVSTFLDPNFSGAYFVLTLILLAQFKSQWRLIFFALVYIALITTYSRSAALMFFGSFFILSIFQKSAKMALLTLGLSLILALNFFIYKQTIANPRNIDRTQSASLRLNSWQQGLKIFELHPFFGVGFNSYRFALKQYNLASEETLQNRGSSGSDSSLLFIASTTGIVGLLFYLSALSALLFISFKNFLSGNKWGLVLLSGLFGLLAQSFFINNLFYPFFLIWIALSSSQLKFKQ